MHGPTDDVGSRSRQHDQRRSECGETPELDLTDFVGAMDAVVHANDEVHDLPLDSISSRQPSQASSSVSFVVALFCDGFVCRHWTRKSGWIEGFAQSYDATSRYFLECLEKERLPDGLLELIDPTTPDSELKAEIWDLRAHPTALCPLTSADLPHTAPLPTEISGVSVRDVVLKHRDHIVLTDVTKLIEDIDHPASEQFPQLSNADLEALTYDELASLTLGLDVDLVQVDESLALLSVDEVVGPIEDEESETNAIELTEIEKLLETAELTESSSPIVKPIPHISVNDDDDHRDDVDVWERRESITPKQITSDDLLPWEHPSTSASSPSALLFPKVMQSQSLYCTNGRKGGVWSSDDDWVMKHNDFRSVTRIDSDPVFIKPEPFSPRPTQRHPTKQAKKKKNDRPTSPTIGPRYSEGISLDQLPASSLNLSLSRDACNWLDAIESNCTSKKKKKKYRSIKPSMHSPTPLPATHLFLSRLRGKRPRNYTIDELDHGSPAWMMMKHMTRFYQAALAFERRHAQFLQVNVERIMTADNDPNEPVKIAAGSMNYVATQLHHYTRPDQVIAAAGGVCRPSSPLATQWHPSEALLHPDVDDEKDFTMRSPTATDEGDESYIPLCPTPGRASLYVTTSTPHPPHTSTKTALPPLVLHKISRSSIRSPLTPLGDSTRQRSSFMEALEGEVFEF